MYSQQQYGMAPGFNAPQRAMNGTGVPIESTPFNTPPPPPAVPLNDHLVVLLVSGLALGSFKAIKSKKVVL